jgi:hypothetical protein
VVAVSFSIFKIDLRGVGAAARGGRGGVRTRDGTHELNNVDIPH